LSTITGKFKIVLGLGQDDSKIEIKNISHKVRRIAIKPYLVLFSGKIAMLRCNSNVKVDNALKYKQRKQKNDKI